MHRISWPNRITLARILLVAPFVVLILHVQDPRWGDTGRRAALAVFAVMAISDGLDGFLARRLKQESAAGRFLDPLADKILTFCSVIILARENTHVVGMRLPEMVAIILIGKEIIVVIGFGIIYLATSRVYIAPQRVGKWCTTLQLLTVIAILLSPDLPVAAARLPVPLWWAASALAVVAVGRYYQVGRKFVAQHETGVRIGDT